MVKNSLANAGNTCSIPGLGRFPGEGMATHSNSLTWTISWREEPGGLQSFRLQELDMTQQMSACMRARTHTHTHICSSDSLFLWVITKYGVEFPLLYGGPLLVTSFIYSSVNMCNIFIMLQTGSRKGDMNQNI